MPDIASLFIFPFLLVFFRLGAMVMVAPGFSDSAVNMRARLLIAVVVAAVMFPLLADTMPALPDKTGIMVRFIMVEIVVGICLGLAAKIFMAVLNIGGEIIAYMSGFQAATLFDPSSGANTTAITLYLMIVAGVLLFSFNVHHILLKGVLESYTVFPAGTFPELSPTVMAVITLVDNVFRIGVQISAPVLVSGFLGYMLLGVFNRLIPQLQVFFVAMPVTITFGLLMLMASLAIMFTVFMAEMGEHINLFGIALAGE